jgi:hypothetical protein
VSPQLELASKLTLPLIGDQRTGDVEAESVQQRVILWSPGDQVILDGNPMKIESDIANPVPLGRLVIIQGDGVDAAHKLLFGDKPVPIKINETRTIETGVPPSSGMVEVAIEEDGTKNSNISFAFLEVG